MKARLEMKDQRDVIRQFKLDMQNSIDKEKMKANRHKSIKYDVYENDG